MKSRLALLLAAAAIPACSGEPLSGPPELRVGKDECIQCGMLIMEDRCSSGMLVEEARERRHVLFDDIGCMLDYEQEKPGGGTKIVERFVHDYDTRAWLVAEQAHFLRAGQATMLTPMGSGIVAFSTPEAAAKQQASLPGRIVRYADLPAVRRAPAEAPKPAEPPPP